MTKRPFLILLTSIFITISAHGLASTENRDLVNYKSNYLHNPAAYIPSQCYTKTQDSQDKIRNPCYSCHTTSIEPNYINDADLQLAYDFSEDPRTNRWSNLFRDRTETINRISDKNILKYIRSSNYFDDQGEIVLSDKLNNPPKQWDYNSNGKWDGFVPDVWFNFDEQGFDLDKKGNYSGWRAFAYYPFLGTFWPTNGSTDDVLIRLPAIFQKNIKGKFDLAVYKTNLAIVEAMIREQDIAIEPVHESKLGNIDINKDGKIASASKVKYDWAPLKKRFMSYVGQAAELQKQGKLKIAAGLYPAGTEFLHTVRYIDVAQDGSIKLSERIKEVRYTRKRQWLNYSKLRAIADGEFKEKHDFPNRLRTIRGNHEFGVTNGQGWTYAAFIEDANGDLRPQTREELAFCVGCHGGVGATRDGIFSFERKLNFETYQHGWYHWTQKSIKGLPDPLRQDGKPEYSFYLEQNGAGDEFRSNQEIIDKFFDDKGQLTENGRSAIKSDISQLLWPSRERAMLLNKAYKTIVDEQSYIHGRDAIIKPPVNVHKQLEADQETGIKQPVRADKLIVSNEMLQSKN